MRLSRRELLELWDNDCYALSAYQKDFLQICVNIRKGVLYVSNKLTRAKVQSEMQRMKLSDKEKYKKEIAACEDLIQYINDLEELAQGGLKMTEKEIRKLYTKLDFVKKSILEQSTELLNGYVGNRYISKALDEQVSEIADILDGLKKRLEHDSR